MSENLPETKENSASNPKMSTDTKFTLKPEVTNNNTVESLDLESFTKKLRLTNNNTAVDESPDLESFTKKLGLNFSKNKDDLRKFYGIYNKSPSTMTEYDRHDIFYYITDPEWDPVGEELAINTIAYCCLIDSGAFRDKPEGTHVLIVYGKILKYYEKGRIRRT
ncbi:hypothetical protein C1646_767893 [Rhizophagus diaphanus]|nr:hypothetical protein C1646_767893 [Rhizophagus diaphanus] [Rhizophagus sp. MUCL 43196]